MLKSVVSNHELSCQLCLLSSMLFTTYSLSCALPVTSSFLCMEFPGRLM